MTYVQTDYWKRIVRATPDEMLDRCIRQQEEGIPRLKEVASHADADSPIHKTIEMAESDLALYKEEKARRSAQKR